MSDQIRPSLPNLLLRAALVLAVLVVTACGTADGGSGGQAPTDDADAKARAARAADVADSVRDSRSQAPTTTTVTPPRLPQVDITCYLNGSYSNSQRFTMDAGGDFAPIWAAVPTSCEAIRQPGTFLPVEQQAMAATGGSILTLYELCATVDPNNTYIKPSHSLSDQQIPEVTGMLTLCPGHPQAQLLKDAVTRGQADAAAEAAGELFATGTFLVNSEVPPGTYAVEGEISNCYWERTNASGEIIDNNFVTGARRVEVTIRASDYSFHNEGCGTWRKVS